MATQVGAAGCLQLSLVGMHVCAHNAACHLVITGHAPPLSSPPACLPACLASPPGLVYEIWAALQQLPYTDRFCLYADLKVRWWVHCRCDSVLLDCWQSLPVLVAVRVGSRGIACFLLNPPPPAGSPGAGGRPHLAAADGRSQAG